MRVRPFAGLLFALLILPLPALASAWEASFPPNTVATYFAEEAGTIVVAAGVPSADLAEAEAALAGALRGSGKAKPVMDDAALGDVSALDDTAIVARAKNLPVQRIAVLRVFAGAEGEAPSAVVTFYDPAGNATGAFSVERGGVLAAADRPAAPGQGASTAAMAAVAEVGKTVSATAAEAQERYDREFVWFEEWVGVSAQSGAVVAAWTVPYQGKYRKQIDGPEFYEIVGRPDLADEYRGTRNLRTGLMIGGGVLTLGGLGVAMSSLFKDCDLDDTACEDSVTNMLIAGGVAGGVGLIGTYIAMAINPHPVEPAEARRLADEYNQRLKKELGLAARDVDAGPQLRAGLAAFPGGGGVSLSGTLF
jgi:hypothetical protein